MNLVISHGFEPNYVVGFARGLKANEVSFKVLSSDELAPRLSAREIDHQNIRGSQNTERKIASKVFNLCAYYVKLAVAVASNAGGTFHFVGLLSSRTILFDGIILPIWLRIFAGRYVHTAHNALPHGREHSRLFRLAYLWIYRFPHAIVVHTPAVAHRLEHEFFVPRTRIRVISIGLNEEVPECSVDRAEARRRLSLPAMRPIALFFGKVDRYKGVDMLAEAWGLVKAPDAYLAIAGWCPEAEYRDEVSREIARSPRRDDIEWRHGFVANEELALWLQACDCVVMPYRHIYQSGIIFLCFRFGVPVVATDVGSLRDFIGLKSGIIASSNDPAGIAAAIDQFFLTRQNFDRSKIARDAQKYNWEAQCAPIKDLYV